MKKDIIIIILLIMILGLSGFIIYDKFIKNQTQHEEENLQNNTLIYDENGNDVTPNYSDIESKLKQLIDNYNYNMNDLKRHDDIDYEIILENCNNGILKKNIIYKSKQSVLEVLNKLKTAKKIEWQGYNDHKEFIKKIATVSCDDGGNYYISGKTIRFYITNIKNNSNTIKLYISINGEDKLFTYNYYFDNTENFSDYFFNLDSYETTPNYSEIENSIKNNSNTIANFQLLSLKCNNNDHYNKMELDPSLIFVILNKLKQATSVNFGFYISCSINPIMNIYEYSGDYGNYKLQIELFDNHTVSLSIPEKDESTNSYVSVREYIFHFDNEDITAFFNSLTNS